MNAESPLVEIEIPVTQTSNVTETFLRETKDALAAAASTVVAIGGTIVPPHYQTGSPISISDPTAFFQTIPGRYASLSMSDTNLKTVEGWARLAYPLLLAATDLGTLNSLEFALGEDMLYDEDPDVSQDQVDDYDFVRFNPVSINFITDGNVMLFFRSNTDIANRLILLHELDEDEDNKDASEAIEDLICIATPPIVSAHEEVALRANAQDLLELLLSITSASDRLSLTLPSSFGVARAA